MDVFLSTFQHNETPLLQQSCDERGAACRSGCKLRHVPAPAEPQRLPQPSSRYDIPVDEVCLMSRLQTPRILGATPTPADSWSDVHVSKKARRSRRPLDLARGVPPARKIRCAAAAPLSPAAGTRAKAECNARGRADPSQEHYQDFSSRSAVKPMGRPAAALTECNGSNPHPSRGCRDSHRRTSHR